MKRKICSIPFCLVVVYLVVVSVNAAPAGSIVTDTPSPYGSAHEWVEITDSWTLVMKYSKDKSTEVPIVFPFSYDGEGYPGLSVSNGGVIFFNAYEDTLFNRPAGNFIFQNGCIPMFRDDLLINRFRYERDVHELYPEPAVLFEGKSKQPLSPISVPEFPTLAVPAGLLVGMIYIIFLLKTKGE